MPGRVDTLLARLIDYQTIVIPNQEYGFTANGLPPSAANLPAFTGSNVLSSVALSAQVKEADVFLTDTFDVTDRFSLTLSGVGHQKGCSLGSFAILGRAEAVCHLTIRNYDDASGQDCGQTPAPPSRTEYVTLISKVSAYLAKLLTDLPKNISSDIFKRIITDITGDKSWIHIAESEGTVIMHTAGLKLAF